MFSVHVSVMPAEVRRASDPLGTGVTDDCELSCGCWESDLGSLGAACSKCQAIFLTLALLKEISQLFVVHHDISLFFFPKKNSIVWFIVSVHHYHFLRGNFLSTCVVQLLLYQNKERISRWTVQKVFIYNSITVFVYLSIHYDMCIGQPVWALVFSDGCICVSVCRFSETR